MKCLSSHRRNDIHSHCGIIRTYFAQYFCRFLFVVGRYGNLHTNDAIDVEKKFQADELIIKLGLNTVHDSESAFSVNYLKTITQLME